MTYLEIMILLSGATHGQSKGIVDGTWYHELLISMLKEVV